MWVIKETYGELCVFYFVRCFEGFYDLFARSFVILQHPVLYLRNTRSLALNVDNKNRMKNDRRLRPVAAIHIDLIFWHLNRFYCQAQNRQDVLLSYSLSFARKKNVSRWVTRDYWFKTGSRNGNQNFVLQKITQKRIQEEMDDKKSIITFS